MKLLSVAAVAAVVLIAGSMRATAAQHSSAATGPSRISIFVPASRLGNAGVRHVTIALDTGTPVPTAVATGTAAPVTTPTVTPTVGPTYPDPVTLLQNMAQKLDLLHSVHFVQTALQRGSVAINVKASGDATCSGPALSAYVKGSASLTGTSQSQHSTFHLILYKNKIFRKAKATHSLWEPATAKSVEPYGFAVQNPLPCPNASGNSTTSGSGGGSDQIKDLVTAGPATISNVAVWHVHATDVQVDQSGNTTDVPVDWYISKSTHLLYDFTESFNDPTQSVSGSIATKLSKFGEHVKIKPPKKGSKKP